MAKTERLEVRLHSDEYQSLQRHAEERGTTVSRLVRDHLGTLLGPHEGDDDPETTTGGWVNARVDLAQWIADRTGTPKAVCALKIARGKVRIAGSPWIEREAPAELLADGVQVEGIAV